MMAASEAQVLEALALATSQQVPEMKVAEELLSNLETKPGFYSLLLRYICNYNLNPTIRWMAALTLKNGIDKYWRRTAPNAILEEEKKVIRQGLLETFREPVHQVGLQLAVIIGKAARFDFPREWPQLVPVLTDLVVKGEDSVSQQQALLVLHHLIKTLASKRLPGDRRIFHDLTNHLYAFILNLYNSSMETFFIQVQNNDMQCENTLEKALIILRVMRKLTIHGFNQPKDSPEVILFVSSVFERTKNMLHVRKTLKDNNLKVDLAEKVIVQLNKVIMSLLEVHPLSFVPFLHPALSLVFQFLFTPAGEEFLFPRFVVQSLSLMNCIVLCVEYKSSNRTEEEEPLQSVVHGSWIKDQFFQKDVLTAICRKLISHYMILTQEELELWESDPEGFVNIEGGESWRYNLRPCSETLFLAIFRSYRSDLAPVIVEMVQANYGAIDPFDLPAVLRKDSVYLAVGLGAFDLYDEIPMEDWYDKLLEEMLTRQGHFRILRRRIAWLLSEWCGVKLPELLRPRLYRALLTLLNDDDDLVVRISAAFALKTSIDDYGFDSENFIELLEPFVNSVFQLLKDVSECDTKMQLLTVFSMVVHCTGPAIKPYSAALTEYLPFLWEQSENHNMLRSGILSCLALFVRWQAIVFNDMYPFLYSVLELSVDTSKDPHLYLMEDGLELWGSMLDFSITATPAMLNLAKAIPPILAHFSEHLPICCEILEGYMYLAPVEFLTAQGEDIFSCCHSLLNDFKPEGLRHIYELVSTCINVEPTLSIPLAMPIILEAFKQIYNQENFPMVLSALLPILSRVLIHSMETFCQIVEDVSKSMNVTGEAAMGRILDAWTERMPLVTNPEKRKLLALALTTLITVDSPIVISKMPFILRNILEALNDITDLGDNGEHIDSILLCNQEQDQEFVADNERERRARVVKQRDPVFNVELRRYFKSQVEELAKRAGNLQEILNVLGTEKIEEFKMYTT